VIRVFIVAASPLARSGLENLVANHGVEVVGSAPAIDSLVPSLLDTEPDAIVVDTSGENLDVFFDSVARFDFEIPVVVVAASSSPRWTAEAIRSGVRAILSLDASREQLFATLLAVASGLFVLQPSEAEKLVPAATAASQTVAELAEPLTRREREVLQMLAAGLANKEIAARLNISDHTAKFHVASILGKLGAATRAEAVTVGIRRGLVLL
jgi:two-component system, NarL family, response regulator YdfI